MKILKFFIVAAAGASMLACSKTNEQDPQYAGEATVTVNIQGANTRADGGTEAGKDAEYENQINTVEFFVFKSDGTFHKYYKPSNLAAKYTFKVDAGNINFMVAVNQNIGEAAATGKSYTEFKKTVASYNLTNVNSRTAIAQTPGFAMAGEGSKTVVAGETNNLEIVVRRLLSKVEAPKEKTGGATVNLTDAEVISLFGQTGTPVVSNVTWAFNGYAVINGINKSFAFEYSNFTGWSRANISGVSNYSTSYDGSGQITSVYSDNNDMAGLDNGFLANNYAGVVYVYESNPTKKASADPDQATVFESSEVVAFLVKGTFNAKFDGVEATPAVRYWRVNLIKDDAWKIFRNSIYRVTMNNINTIGWPTPEEAENEGPIVDPTESSISIDINVAPWDVRLQGVDL